MYTPHHILKHPSIYTPKYTFNYPLKNIWTNDGMYSGTISIKIDMNYASNYAAMCSARYNAGTLTSTPTTRLQSILQS
jgi:hypothetical protein